MLTVCLCLRGARGFSRCSGLCVRVTTDAWLFVAHFLRGAVGCCSFSEFCTFRAETSSLAGARHHWINFLKQFYGVLKGSRGFCNLFQIFSVLHSERKPKFAQMDQFLKDVRHFFGFGFCR